MEVLRKLRWFLYPTVFVLVFFFTFLFSIPKSAMQEIADKIISVAALSMGPMDREMPIVSMKSASTWRLSGIDIEKLGILWPFTNTKPAIDVQIDRFRARLGIFAFLMGKSSLSTNVDMYGGNFYSYIKIDKNRMLNFLELAIEDIDLEKIDILKAVVGTSFAGKVKSEIVIDNPSGKMETSSGKIFLDIKNAKLDAGAIKLSSGGFNSGIDIPAVLLGQIIADLTIAEGKATTNKISIEGGDVEASMDLTISLDNKLGHSSISGKGWFSVKQELINSNDTLKTLFDILPQLQAAKLNSGKVGFSLSGSLSRPNFRLEEYSANLDKKKTPAVKAPKVS